MVIAVDLVRPVAVDPGWCVDVVHHQIQRAVVVQVHVRGAGRESRLGQAPRLGHVGKGEVPVVAIRVAGNRHVRHLLEQRGELLVGHPVGDRCLDLTVGHEGQEVHVVRPTVDAGRHQQILVAVVVQVGEQRRPAPVGRVHTREVPNLAESPLTAVEVQDVFRHLRMKTRPAFQNIDGPVVGVDGRLEDLLPCRQHVEHHDVRSAVIVDVGGIDAHGGAARMTHRRLEGLGERAVTVVDVDEVTLVEIVGDEQIGTAVEVQVAGHDAKAVSVDTAEHTGRLADIHEPVAFVAEQAVARPRMADGALRVENGAALLVRGVVEQVHVQIAVSVVVEEGGLGRISLVLESVFGGPVGKGAITVVDEEDVATAGRQVADRRDVDIEVAVAVHVGHRDTALPARDGTDAGSLGDVLEPEVARVAIEPVGTEVRREVQVRQAVAVHITGSHAPAVIEIQVVDDVELGSLRQLVGECHPGGFRGKQLEQGLGTLYGAAGQRQHAGGEQSARKTRSRFRGAALGV